MGEKIRILRIHNRLHLGGPIFNVTYLTKYLPSDIYETKLIIGPQLPDEISAVFFLEKEGVPFTLIEEMRRSPDPFNDIRAFLKIRQIIRDFKPHIVHTHTAKAGTLGRLAAWSCGIPITFHTFHGHVFHSYFSAPVNFGIRLFERTLARFTSNVITISNKQKLEICGEFSIVAPEKCPVVPLGFDLNKFRQDPEARRTAFRNKYALREGEVAVGIIGRFAPIKNHMLLFKAIILLKNQHPCLSEKLVVFCVGDGELKATFQAFLEKEQIPYSNIERSFSNGGIVFTSWIKEVELILPGLDLVALTSDNEGTPLSLIEAQAAGVPVLSTEVGGVEDVIVKDQSGWLVPKNNPEALMQSLAKILQNAGQLSKSGKIGTDWVMEKFSYQRLVGDVDRLYRRALMEHSIPVSPLPVFSQKNPLVSIITVCKNRLSTLVETIHSVEIQDYPFIEYIVIDGGSVDGSLDYIKSHPRVNKYLSEPDNGIYHAMNKGIEIASGEVIAFLNSDDHYTDKNVIRLVIATFIKSNADAVFGDIVYTKDDAGKKITRYWKSGRYNQNSFKWGWMPPHPAFFVKAAIFREYGKFSEDLFLAADYELMLRFIHMNGIHIEYIPRILVNMRSGGASNKYFRNRLKANQEDRIAWKMNQVKPGFLTLWLKPFRKLPQWLFSEFRVHKKINRS